MAKPGYDSQDCELQPSVQASDMKELSWGYRQCPRTEGLMQGWGLDRCYRGPSGKAGPPGRRCMQPNLGSERPPQVHVSEEQSWGLSPQRPVE